MAALSEGRYDVETESVLLRGEGGDPVSAFHARPDGMPTRGLVVHPDIGGNRPLFDDLCRRLATHGVAVICPEPFARAITAGVDLSDLDRRMAYVAKLDDQQQINKEKYKSIVKNHQLNRQLKIQKLRVVIK